MKKRSIAYVLAAVLALIILINKPLNARAGFNLDVYVKEDGTLYWTHISDIDEYKIEVKSFNGNYSLTDYEAWGDFDFDVTLAMRRKGFPSGKYEIKVTGYDEDGKENAYGYCVYSNYVFSKIQVEGTVTLDKTAAVVYDTLSFTLDGQISSLPASDLTIRWAYASYLDDIWITISEYENKTTFYCEEKYADKYIRVFVGGNPDIYEGTVKSAPVQVVKMANTAIPTMPTTQFVDSKIYLLAEETQEYVISDSPTIDADSTLWASAMKPETSGLMELKNLIYGKMNYIHTRFAETGAKYAGEEIRTAFLWYGSSTTGVEGTYLTISVASFAGGVSHDGYWEGDLLCVQVLPMPSSSSNTFTGFLGSNWYYPLMNDTSYGVFFADSDCTTPLDANTRYKTVYLKLKQPLNNAYISAGLTSEHGSDIQIDVADSQGRYKIDKVIVPTYSVEIGKVTTGLPFSYQSEGCEYYLDYLYVERDYNTGMNGPEGTEPIVTFSSDGTMTVDATDCILSPYSLVIKDSYGRQVGKMVVNVGAYSDLPETITIKNGDVSAYPGTGFSLTFSFAPENSFDNMTVVSSDPSIVSVRGAIVYVDADAPVGSSAVITATGLESGITTSIVVTVVEPTVKITGQPKDYEGRPGVTASFSVAVSGMNLTYVWQYSDDDGASWNATGCKTATQTCVLSEETDGRLFRCIITKSTDGYQVISNEARAILVKEAPEIVSVSGDETVAAGKGVVLSVTAKYVTGYKWQVSKDGGSTWKDVNADKYPSALTDRLSFTVKATMNGYMYRCVVSNEYGSVEAGPVVLTIITKPTITTQPGNKSVNEGASATFKVVASGIDLKYKWQVSKDSGSTWKDVDQTKYPSAATATLKFTAKASMNGYKYRCVVSNAAGHVNSTGALLTVKSGTTKPVITTQPSNQTTTLGTEVTFKVAATGATGYQWEYSKNNGVTWTVWKGKTSATLKVTASTTNNGCLYRCQVTNAAGTTTSNEAKLTVKDVKPTITQQPSAKTVTSGATAKFTVVAAGSSLTYKWQVSKDGGNTWKDVDQTKYPSAATATLSFTTKASMNGYQYRCIVSNAYGSTNSNSAKLTVN